LAGLSAVAHDSIFDHCPLNQIVGKRLDRST
jgi:hypothetical protein